MIAVVVLAWLMASAAPAANDVAADEARALYVEAKNAYDGGRFDEALQGFQAAFAKKPLPGFLFNLGQCERQLGHHQRAIFFFERYLDEKPDAANRSTVEELIAESRAQLARAPAPPPASTSATTAPASLPATTAPTTSAATSSPAPALATTPSLAPIAAPPGNAVSADEGTGMWPVVAATAVAVTVGVAVGVGVALAVTSSQPTLGTHEVTP